MQYKKTGTPTCLLHSHIFLKSDASLCQLIELPSSVSRHQVVCARSSDCTCTLAFQSICVTVYCDEFFNTTFILFYFSELVLRLCCVSCFMCSILSKGSMHVDENVSYTDMTHVAVLIPIK